MAWCVLRLQEEELPSIWRVAANILNKQLRAAEKGWSSSLGVGWVVTTPHYKNIPCYEMFTQTALDLVQDRDRWRALVTVVMNLQVP
jgi:hypothetical protein